MTRSFSWSLFVLTALADRRFATIEELRVEVNDYSERFYHRQRRHSTLGYLSPALYELRHAA